MLLFVLGVGIEARALRYARQHCATELALPAPLRRGSHQVSCAGLELALWPRQGLTFVSLLQYPCDWDYRSMTTAQLLLALSVVQAVNL